MAFPYFSLAVVNLFSLYMHFFCSSLSMNRASYRREEQNKRREYKYVKYAFVTGNRE